MTTTKHKSLPRPGDTLLDPTLGNFTCCTQEYLLDTYSVGNHSFSKRPVVFGYQPKNNSLGVDWLCYELSQVPPFIQCHKNKPKDKVYYQEVRYNLDDKSTSVSGLDITKSSWHNTKVTFCGSTGELKSSEVL